MLKNLKSKIKINSMIFKKILKVFLNFLNYYFITILRFLLLFQKVTEYTVWIIKIIILKKNNLIQKKISKKC